LISVIETDKNLDVRWGDKNAKEIW
jgi:hypothetical protein